MARDRLPIDARLAAELDRRLAPDGILADLYAELTDHPAANMLTHPDLGRLLRVLVGATGGRRVLEIGTFAGASAIWMAGGLVADGVIDTLEIDGERADLAERWLARAGVADRVRVVRGDARATLAGLRPGYDLCYVDADKRSYPEYLDRALGLVRTGGLIVADNLFLGGALADPAPDPRTAAMRAFADRLLADPRLRSTLLTVGDGVSLSLVGPPPGAPGA